MDSLKGLFIPCINRTDSLSLSLPRVHSLSLAVIKMEGGTDHDLQVLELPVSTLVGGEGPVGGGGGGGGDGGGSSVAAAPVATGTPGTKPDTEPGPTKDQNQVVALVIFFLLLY